MADFNTHTYEAETFDLDGPTNRAGQITATRRSDGATFIVRVYANGDGGVVLHTINPADVPVIEQED